MITENEPLTLERKLDILVEVLEGLAYAHERGVIHRDIKPSNIRLTAEGRVKIMDFGIARLQSADLTGSGAIVGTPNYMAPEQVTNGPITPATDLFSVGCLLYELLSYHKPFEGETVHGVLYQVLTTEPKPLRTVAPSMPAALERVVAKALNKVPEDRYQTARPMQQALLGIRAALSGASERTARMTPGWTSLPAPILRLVTHTPLRWRIVVLSALAVVALILAFVSRGSVLSPPETAPSVVAAPAPPPTLIPTPAAPAPEPVTLDEYIATPVTKGTNAALVALRDSALEARARAERAGAMKNNVRSVVLAETILLTAEQSRRRGDQSRASSGYISAVPQYRRAQAEADKLRAEARLQLDRSTPVVQGIAMGPAATRAATSLARAESLYAAMDYTLAKLAAQDAEQVGVAEGVAPPSPQPADPHAGISMLLLDLARAVASERVENLRLIFPSMTEADAQSWKSFFERATRLEASFSSEQLQVYTTEASAIVAGVYRFVPRQGGAQREERSRYVMGFVKSPAGWRIASVQPVSK
jgi:serine/threonine-protein kinase